MNLKKPSVGYYHMPWTVPYDLDISRGDQSHTASQPGWAGNTQQMNY